LIRLASKDDFSSHDDGRHLRRWRLLRRNRWHAGEHCHCDQRPQRMSGHHQPTKPKAGEYSKATQLTHVEDLASIMSPLEGNGRGGKLRAKGITSWRFRTSAGAL